MPRPNFQKDQYIISAEDNSDNNSAQEEDFNCLTHLTHWLIIQDIFVTQKFL